MPELPEVETVKNGLSPTLKGQTLQSVQILRRDLRITAPADIETQLKSTTVTDLTRRSKLLLIHLNHNKTLVLHLGMSGTLTIQPIGTEARKHDHIIIATSQAQIHFNDPRRFGFYDLVASDKLNQQKYIINLGVEPLDPDFTYQMLYNIMRKRQVRIKQALMDNSKIVGIGNIYASEILHLAAIHPLSKAHKIRPKQAETLHKCIINVLNEAIAAGGSSLKDHKQASGKLGYFQHAFKVYGRAGEPCSTCQNKIEKWVQNGRATFACNVCQKYL